MMTAGLCGELVTSMSAIEKTGRGSYGQKMPGFATPVMKAMNGLMIRRFHKGGARMGGLDLLVLTTVGAKSGQHRQTLLGSFPEGSDSWLVAASSGGAATNPAWYHNVVAHPDQVQLEVGGRTFPVAVTQLAGEERDAAWGRIISAQPRYAGYEKKTDRHIPVLRLTQV
jgi:deazaflavin-dependent oxidoreductase (nitroreductase family)